MWVLYEARNLRGLRYSQLRFPNSTRSRSLFNSLINLLFLLSSRSHSLQILLQSLRARSGTLAPLNAFPHWPSRHLLVNLGPERAFLCGVPYYLLPHLYLHGLNLFLAVLMPRLVPLSHPEHLLPLIHHLHLTVNDWVKRGLLQFLPYPILLSVHSLHLKQMLLVHGELVECVASFSLGFLGQRRAVEHSHTVV